MTTALYRPLKLHRLAVAAAAALVLGSVVAAEGGLHIHDRPKPNARIADEIARETESNWETARTSARDGVVLDGWLFTPLRPNGAGAILLHGVGDSRAGMSDLAKMLLRAGYTVLTPDCRGHGSSGGDVISYGVKEGHDVHSWCDWLLSKRSLGRLYGMGRSMGAGIILQSLARETRFRAVVAECPFATFEQMAYHRMGQASYLGHVALWPIVNLGFGYAHLRYGIDLSQASALEALRSSRTPVLLIHGTADTNIPPGHSEALHTASPATTTLWLVPGAGHLESMKVDPDKYRNTVLAFLESH